MPTILFLAFSLLLQGALGELICDELPVGMCAFSIATSGKRCSLETGDQSGIFQCKTSEVYVHRIREYIESDECLTACGVHRNVIGISSDFLLDPIFISKICSQPCQNNCSNIVDLYSNLALAEGTLLSKLCKALETGPRRAMSQLKSSGIAVSDAAAGGPISAPAPGPISGDVITGSAPAASPPGSSAASAPAPL